MRILLLTILLATPVYFLTHEEEVHKPEIDSIRLKVSGPDRSERILTVKEPVPVAEGAATEEVSEVKPEISDSVESDLEHVEEVELSDIEEGWNNELKDMLGRLEPAEGESIHKSYVSEQESYQTELDALLNEKQQKTTDEAALEIEHLIGQLDAKHQEKLKDILGAHYEAVRDHYEDFMDASPADE
jgi:hypothetical protein